MGFIIKTEEEKYAAYIKHIGRKHEQMEQREAEKRAYREAYKEARIKYETKQGEQAGNRPRHNTISNLLLGPPKTIHPPEHKHAHKHAHKHVNRGWVEQSPFGPYRYTPVNKKKKDFDLFDNWNLWR